MLACVLTAPCERKLGRKGHIVYVVFATVCWRVSRPRLMNAGRPWRWSHRRQIAATLGHDFGPFAEERKAARRELRYFRAQESAYPPARKYGSISSTCESSQAGRSTSWE